MSSLRWSSLVESTKQKVLTLRIWCKLSSTQDTIEFHITVRSRYLAVTFRDFNHKRHPIAGPSERGTRCLSWVHSLYKAFFLWYCGQYRLYSTAIYQESIEPPLASQYNKTGVLQNAICISFFDRYWLSFVFLSLTVVHILNVIRAVLLTASCSIDPVLRKPEETRVKWIIHKCTCLWTWYTSDRTKQLSFIKVPASLNHQYLYSSVVFLPISIFHVNLKRLLL